MNLSIDDIEAALRSRTSTRVPDPSSVGLAIDEVCRESGALTVSTVEYFLSQRTASLQAPRSVLSNVQRTCATPVRRGALSYWAVAIAASAFLLVTSWYLTANQARVHAVLLVAPETQDGDSSGFLVSVRSQPGTYVTMFAVEPARGFYSLVANGHSTIDEPSPVLPVRVPTHGRAAGMHIGTIVATRPLGNFDAYVEQISRREPVDVQLSLLRENLEAGLGVENVTLIHIGKLETVQHQPRAVAMN